MRSTTQGAGNVVDSSLVLYLDAANRMSYPGSGATWFDMSDYKNHFTLVNAPTHTGGSLYFNSVAYNQKAQCVNTTFGNWGTSSFTIEYVLNLAGESGYKPTVIMKRYGAVLPGGTDRSGFSIVESTPGNGAGQFLVQSTSNQWIETNRSPAYDITNTIVHCTHVFERNNGGVSNTGSSYLNGSLRSSINRATFTIPPYDVQSTITTNTQLMYNQGENRYIKGALHLIRAYNRALTAAEIRENYIALQPRFFTVP